MREYRRPPDRVTSRLPNSFVKVSIGRLTLFLSDNKIIGQTTDGFKISNMFGQD
jgi:hypothetical protein